MNIPVHITPAQLPTAYEAARNALAECQAVDECKDWADKAAALASYAKQADDVELEKMAVRIRSRAQRRMGELLKQFDGRGGDQRPESKSNATGTFAPSQKDIARQAGISKRQQVTAVRIANIPEKESEAAVESDNPPNVTTLAAMSVLPRNAPDPESWLKGRTPEGFNAAMRLEGMLERYAKEITGVDLDFAISNLEPDQIETVRRCIQEIDALHSMIVTVAVEQDDESDEREIGPEVDDRQRIKKELAHWRKMESEAATRIGLLKYQQRSLRRARPNIEERKTHDPE